ncbi:glycerophosphoinositol permease [Marasmius tenuissimus]|nr:glycerophosphoinositol permease [Marasmius tenuissimus]
MECCDQVLFISLQLVLHPRSPPCRDHPWPPLLTFSCEGTVCGAFIIDYLGPKYTMIMGLLAQAVIGFIMSGAYTHLTRHIAAFAVVYGIFLSLGELGPGNNLGLLASKTSPTAVRGQFYGVAAAIGKVGAFVGTWAFPPMIDAFGGSDSNKGNTGPFWIGSGLAILSALVTLIFIKPLDHDGMAKEDALFREYLEQHGYDTSFMGLKGASRDSVAEEFVDEEKVGAQSRP